MPAVKDTLSRPARAGERITIYATGLDEIVDPVVAGNHAPLDPATSLTKKVSVVIGNTEIKPAFAGLAPGTVGVFQVDVQLSQAVSGGSAVPLWVRVKLDDGTVKESNQVTLAIEA